MFLNENIAKAMIWKDYFLSMYKVTNPGDAALKLETWIIEAKNSGLQPLIDLADTFKNKFDMIINYFKRKISSAISEGINAVFRFV